MVEIQNSFYFLKLFDLNKFLYIIAEHYSIVTMQSLKKLIVVRLTLTLNCFGILLILSVYLICKNLCIVQWSQVQQHLIVIKIICIISH